MTKRKLAIGLMIAAIATVGAAAAFGCNDKNGNDNPANTDHEHTYSTEWTKDDAHHWHAATCEHTNQTKDYAEHEYDDDADATCNTCGYTREVHVHTYSTEWTKNETHHWHAATCDHTDEKKDEGEHSFTTYADNGDGTCTATCVCGLTDTHAHDYATEYVKGETQHWHTCKDCGAADTKVNHDSTAWNDEDGDGVYTKHCSTCGFVTIHGATDHVYTREIKQRYLVTYAEGTGAEIGREVNAYMCSGDKLKHIQICSVCGHESEAQEHNYAYADNYGYAHLKYCVDCEFYDNNDGNYEDDGKGDGYAHENSEEVICVSEASAMGTYGYHYVVCKYCHAETATIHSFDSNLTRIPNNDGTHTIKCSGCDYEVTEDCTKAANGYETWLHNTGEHWTKCVWCQGKLPATASVHTGANWVENNGTYTGTCSVCGESVTHTTHEWAEGWACGETDITKHYHYCSVCHIVNEDGASEAHSYTNGQCICGAYSDMVAQATGNTNAPTDISSRVTNNTAHYIATSSDYTGYYKYIAAQDGWVTVTATELTTDIAGFGAIYYNVVPDTTNATGNYIYQSGRSKVPAGLYSCTYTVNATKNTLLSEFKLYVKQGEYIIFTVAGYKTGATMGTPGALTNVVLTVDTTTAAPAPVYAITWNLQGHGTAIPMSATVAGKAVEPDEPTAKGVAFEGWCTDTDCTNAFDFETTLTQDITLYAKWTISYDGSSEVSPLLKSVDQTHTTVALATEKTDAKSFLYSKITVTGSGEIAFAMNGTSNVLDSFGFAINGNGFEDIAWTEHNPGNMPKSVEVANGDIIYVKSQALENSYTLNVNFTAITGNIYTVTVEGASGTPLNNITVNFGATANATTYLHTATTDANGQVKWSSEFETVYVIIEVEEGKQLTGITTLTAAVPTTTLTISTAAATVAFAEGTVISRATVDTPATNITLNQLYSGVTTEENYSELKIAITENGTYTFEVEGESARIAFQMIYINGLNNKNNRVYNNGTDNTGSTNLAIGHAVTMTLDGGVTYTTGGATKTNHRIVSLTLEAADVVYIRLVNAKADGTALSTEANAFTFKATKA